MAATVTTETVEVAVKVPPKRGTEAVAEFEVLEIENSIFNRSFVEIAVESATKVKTVEATRTRVLEATQMSAQMQMLKKTVPGKPPATNNNFKNGGSNGAAKPWRQWDTKVPGDGMLSLAALRPR